MIPEEALDQAALDQEQVESMVYFVGKFMSLMAGKALLYVAVVFSIGLGLLIIGLWGKHHDHE